MRKPSVTYLETLAKNLLQVPETLGKYLDKILTKSAKNMYDLARSCQELQKKYLIFLTQKTDKKGFWYKKPLRKNQESCQEIQEIPRILARNPGKPKNKREKVRD